MTTEPSEKTKALLEAQRAAKAAAGDGSKTTTIVEDANMPSSKQPDVADSDDNSDLALHKRASDRLAAEQARGKQVVAQHHAAHKRAVAAQKASDKVSNKTDEEDTEE